MAIINNIKEVTRGDTALYSVALYDANGDEFVPDEGSALTFYLMKRDCDDLTEAILTKPISPETMQLELEPSETRSLATGSYAYRIRLVDTVGHEWTVVKSKIKIIC